MYNGINWQITGQLIALSGTSLASAVCSLVAFVSGLEGRQRDKARQGDCLFQASSVGSVCPLSLGLLHRGNQGFLPQFLYWWG